jgi:hypothetical protein
MATGTITTWGGTITDIGPMYPFLGSEGFLVLVLLVFWIGWHILQLRGEGQEHERDRADLKTNKEVAKRLMERDGD